MRPLRRTSWSPTRCSTVTWAPSASATPPTPGIASQPSRSSGIETWTQNASVPTSVASGAPGPTSWPRSTWRLRTIALNGAVMPALLTASWARRSPLFAALTAPSAALICGSRAATEPSGAVSPNASHSLAATRRRLFSTSSWVCASVTCAACCSTASL